jgi:hypothetical protein
LNDTSNTSYNVYRKVQGGSYGAAVTNVSDSSNYEDSNTTVGVTYYYKIRPVNGGVEGLESNEGHTTASSTITEKTLITRSSRAIAVASASGTL